MPRPFFPPNVTLDHLKWVDSSDNDDRSRLLATLQLDDVNFHVEAYEATEGDGVQQFKGAYGDTPEKVYEAIGCDGPWYTVTIDGREYVLIITPFCR